MPRLNFYSKSTLRLRMNRLWLDRAQGREQSSLRLQTLQAKGLQGFWIDLRLPATRGLHRNGLAGAAV